MDKPVLMNDALLAYMVCVMHEKLPSAPDARIEEVILKSPQLWGKANASLELRNISLSMSKAAKGQYVNMPQKLKDLLAKGEREVANEGAWLARRAKASTAAQDKKDDALIAELHRPTGSNAAFAEVAKRVVDEANSKAVYGFAAAGAVSDEMLQKFTALQEKFDKLTAQAAAAEQVLEAAEKGFDKAETAVHSMHKEVSSYGMSLYELAKDRGITDSEGNYMLTGVDMALSFAIVNTKFGDALLVSELKAQADQPV